MLRLWMAAQRPLLIAFIATVAFAAAGRVTAALVPGIAVAALTIMQLAIAGAWFACLGEVHLRYRDLDPNKAMGRPRNQR